MSEAGFLKHLDELNDILDKLTGDIESGPPDVVDEWYSDTLDLIYDYEDVIDRNLHARIGISDDAVDDGDLLIEEDNMEDVEAAEDEETDEDEEDLEETDEEVYETGNTENGKTITIKINLTDT